MEYPCMPRQFHRDTHVREQTLNIKCLDTLNMGLEAGQKIVLIFQTLLDANLHT